MGKNKRIIQENVEISKHVTYGYLDYPPSEVLRENMLQALEASSQLLNVRKMNMKANQEKKKNYYRLKRFTRFKGSYNLRSMGKPKNNSMGEKMKAINPQPYFECDEDEARQFFEAIGIRRIRPCQPLCVS